MVKIHAESCSQKDLKNKINTTLVGGLYTTIVNSIVWRTQYDITRITKNLHEFGRQLGEVFYPLLSKTLDPNLIEKKLEHYIEEVWKIVFLRKPDKCKWDKDSNQLVIISKSCELCQNISEPVHFPFSEAIAGFIEAIIECALEDIGVKGRFSSSDILCHESECRAKDGTPYCKFILARGEASV